MQVSMFKEWDENDPLIAFASGCHLYIKTPVGFDPEIILCLTYLGLKTVAELSLDPSQAIQLSDKLKESAEFCIERQKEFGGEE